MGSAGNQPSTLDSLTGLKNRRHFDGVLHVEVARAHRDGRRLSLVLLDLDKFKRVNEEAGHERGDLALRSFAQRVGEAARATDVTCRIGGDEFAVVLPASSFDDATQLSVRVNDRLVAEPIPALRHVTVSYGIVELADGEDAEGLLMRADRALYESKEGPPPSDPSGVREPRRPKPPRGSAGVKALSDNEF